MTSEKSIQELENAVKKKRGRPRKFKKEETSEPVEKKKRGRKKKIRPEGEEIKVKKRRGRKAAVKYFSSSIRKKIPLTTSIEKNDELILHLDITDNNIKEFYTDDSFSGIDQSKQKFVYKNSKENLEQDEFDNHNDNHDKIQDDFEDFLNDTDKEQENILFDFLKTNQLDLDEKSLRELYESRLKNRELEDEKLLKKLDSLNFNNNDILTELLNKKSTINQEYESYKDKHNNDDKDIQDDTHENSGICEILENFKISRESDDENYWPEKTDVACWWCCHKFTSFPLGLPMRYDEHKNLFRVSGVFCSFSCIIAYKNELNISNVNHLIKFLYNKLTGTNISNTSLTTAPPRSFLKMFGGKLSIEEFRSKSKEHSVYKMIKYPMILSKDYIEEQAINNVKNINTNLFNNKKLENNNHIIGKLDNLNRISNNLKKNYLSKKDINLSEPVTVVNSGKTMEQFINFD
jgi:hypothetical protein